MNWKPIESLAVRSSRGAATKFDLPPSDEDIVRLRELNFPFSGEYLSLFESYNGQGSPGFLGIANALELKETFDEFARELDADAEVEVDENGVPLPDEETPEIAKNARWLTDWFPLYSTGDSFWCTFDFRPSSRGRKGQVLYTTFEGVRECVAPSFEEWLKLYVRVLLGEEGALPSI